MERQRLTDETYPLRFHAVIEQTVIERKIGGDAVMRQQLEHVLRMMARDNVEVQVMPTAVAVHDGLDGDFVPSTSKIRTVSRDMSSPPTDFVKRRSRPPRRQS